MRSANLLHFGGRIYLAKVVGVVGAPGCRDGGGSKGWW